MREAVAELNDAIARLLVRPDRQLELAADFAGLFLVDPKQGALPYESLYRGEAKLLMQAPMTEMQARLDRLGINVSDKYKEPADHLAIELDLMGNLIIRAAEAKSAVERNAGSTSRKRCCTATCWGGSTSSKAPVALPTSLAFMAPVHTCLDCFSKWIPITWMSSNMCINAMNG